MGAAGLRANNAAAVSPESTERARWPNAFLLFPAATAAGCWTAASGPSAS